MNFYEELPNIIFNKMDIDNLKNTLNGGKNFKNKYHEEESVYDHIMMVYDEVQKRFANDNDRFVLSMGALLHDIGKIEARVENQDIQKTTFYNHEMLGFYPAIEKIIFYKMTRDGSLDNETLTKILKIVLFHDIYKYDIETLKTKFTYDDLILLAKFSLCDSAGRITSTPKNVDMLDDILKMEQYDNNHYNEDKPNIIFPIGLPCSGKSTDSAHLTNFVILSRDELVMKRDPQGNYNEIFKGLTQEEHKQIDDEFDNLYLKAVQKRQNIFVDRTNTSKKGRNKLLNRSSTIKKEYNRVAWIYCVPMFELMNRNKNRVNKTIDLSVFEMFKKSLNIPDLTQFDKIEFLWR